MLLLSFETRELAVSDRKTSAFGFCRAEAIRVSGAVHGSYYEHCLLLGIVVAEATQRLVTTSTLLPF